MAVITGTNASETLVGTAGNDKITGGAGSDLVQMGDGADLFIWLSGHGKDTVEGGSGFDTARFTATKIADGLGLLADGAGARMFSNLESVGLDSIERVEIQALGGADTITIGDLEGTGVTEVAIDLSADGMADTVSTTGTLDNDIVNIASTAGKIVVAGLPAEVSIANAAKTDFLFFDGGEGNDIINAAGLAAGKVSLQIFGGIGEDVIFAGAGNDTVIGGVGNDLVYLGAGNDLFASNSGDAVDTIEGQDGTDTVRLNTLGIGTIAPVSLVADDGRAKISGPAQSLSLNDVERVEIHTSVINNNLISIGDLSGTDLKQVAIVLAGDDQFTDVVTCFAGAGNDVIDVTATGTVASITGLAAHLTIAGSISIDALSIDGDDGHDKIDASKLPQGLLAVNFDGGAGNDVLVGGQGSDSLVGAQGHDTVAGGGGSDLVFLDGGNDLFQWNPGDGSDDVEGGGGTDTARIAGSKANDDFTITPGGLFGSVLSSKALGMGLDLGTERLELLTLDGADKVVIENLGAGASFFEEISIDLAATIGGKTADTKTDTLDLRFSGDDNDIVLSTSGSKVSVAGLLTEITVDHAGKTDGLTIQAGIGADDIDASAVAAGKIALVLRGQQGDDTIVGSAGNDRVEGGDGDDIVSLGLGNDLFIWKAGDDDDTIEGEGGTDTVQVKATTALDIIAISALAGRVQVAAPAGLLDMNDVERLDIQAAGGGDSIIVNDLAGADLKQVSIGLALDGKDDDVFATGTAGNDKITVSMSGASVSVTGLPAQVTVANVEASDGLVVLGGSGHDTITAATVAAGKLQLALHGEIGNDTITGGLGGDDLFGEDGNDALLGGAGNDTLSGGVGKDTITGGAGNDLIVGGEGNDTINVSGGHAHVVYLTFLDGHDVVTGFDGNATGGQDTFDLDFLFDNLGTSTDDRAARVSIIDKGATVDIAFDTDGNVGNGFELVVATLKTADNIAIGQDVIVGVLEPD
jgi:Ca2+-binding RTX toxin-like protein